MTPQDIYESLPEPFYLEETGIDVRWKGPDERKFDKVLLTRLSLVRWL